MSAPGEENEPEDRRGGMWRTWQASWETGGVGEREREKRKMGREGKWKRENVLNVHEGVKLFLLMYMPGVFFGVQVPI